jgi:hypothetical protein
VETQGLAMADRICACYGDASWIVDYHQQRVDPSGERLVLLQGEADLQRFAPLRVLKLESIECP